MLKLIKLEWKKNNIGKYVRNAVILAGLLCLFIFWELSVVVPYNVMAGQSGAIESKAYIYHQSEKEWPLQDS